MSVFKALGKWIAGSPVPESQNAAESVSDAGIKTATGMVPISETAGNDVFIIGYPKSGNTWFQCLAAGLVYGVDVQYAPDSIVQDLVPDVHVKHYYKRYGPAAYFKSHDLPKPHHKRVVYLLRDGRDAMVSYYHFLRALARERDVDFMKVVRDGESLFPGKWHDHVQQWTANPFGADFITIRYEDLKADPLVQLKKFCEFAGLQRDDSFVDLVIQQSCFESMRKREIQQGWSNPAWPQKEAFIRRGKVGSYQDEMPAEVLDCFLKEAGDTLRKTGYL